MAKVSIDFILAKFSAIMLMITPVNRNMKSLSLLALANGNDPICVMPPNVAKASKEGDITIRYQAISH